MMMMMAGDLYADLVEDTVEGDPTVADHMVVDHMPAIVDDCTASVEATIGMISVSGIFSTNNIFHLTGL